MISAMLLNNNAAPKKGDDQAVAGISDGENPDGENPDARENSDPAEPATQDPDTADPDSPKKENSGDTPEGDLVTTGDESTNPDSSRSTLDPKTADTPKVVSGDETDESVVQPVVDNLVSFGSVNADGSDRYLITANKLGGTIRRVELNFRDANGRYRYRDAVWKGGYLGCLDCVDTNAGCTVRVVGDSTPAQLAGILAGDVIVSINGEPVVSADEFESILKDPKKSKPKQTLQIVIKRNGVNQTVAVALTEKPIEIIRPETGIVDPDFNYPESFVMSLLSSGGPREKAWPDLNKHMRDGTWESNVTPTELEFKYVLSNSDLEPAGLLGPITVYKRFKLPTLTANEVHNVDSRSFHLELELEVVNGSDKPQSLAYELDGPTGLTAEGWWYENKIHGRQMAIGYIAGARDIVGRTGDNSYVFFGFDFFGSLRINSNSSALGTVSPSIETMMSPARMPASWAGVASPTMRTVHPATVSTQSRHPR